MEPVNGMVSVIITTYNRECDILKRAVESVLSQTYKNIEILIIDDNKPDYAGSAQIKQEMSEYDCVRYIKQPQNMGAQVARNTGIFAARGEYTAFLDDDDEWLPQKLEKQLSIFRSNPSAGLVFCNGYRVLVNNSGEQSTTYNPFFKENVTFSDMLYMDYVGTTTQAMIRRDVFAKAGLFDTDFPARQDYEMWLRISRYYDVQGCPDKLFKHYIYEGERISGDPQKGLRGYFSILRKYNQYYRKNAKARSQLYFFIEKNYKAAGMKFKGNYYMIKKLMLDPGRIIRKLRKKGDNS
ncbi:MAG: glycosyltransferase family 2 protein [Oscillospiraceae bacterium]|nr:glycosyltransferase family 2 protein [Oscillospiraceae bacterium]